MLHIIKHTRSLSEALLHASDKDAILLVEDAVYAALPKHKLHTLFGKLDSVYCLTADTDARGLNTSMDLNSSSRVSLVDFSGFVALTEKHQQSITWD